MSNTGSAASAATTVYGAREAPEVPLVEFKRRAELKLAEFLVEGDLPDACQSFKELAGSAHYAHHYVRRAILMSMARGDREREMVSRLVSHLHDGGLLSVEHVAKAFELLFETMDDARIDVHDVRSLTARFLGRAVADECLPVGFLSDPLVVSLAGDIVSGAQAVQSAKHVWGVTDAFSISELKRSAQSLIEEYFLEGDLTEAARRTAEMQAPHFHHEVVFRALQWCVDHAPDAAVEAATLRLLTHLGATGAASSSSSAQALVGALQFVEGFRRAVERLEDLSLDAPLVTTTLDRLLRGAQSAGLFPADYATPFSLLAHMPA